MRLPQMTASSSLRKGMNPSGQARRFVAALRLAQSGLDDRRQDQSGVIYAIVKNPCYGGRGGRRCRAGCLVGDVTPNDYVYVGKTIQGGGERFVQHAINDTYAPWHQDRVPDGAYRNDDALCWPYFQSNLWTFRGVTRFDVAAAEQYYIQEAIQDGARLENRRNELTRAKFDQLAGDRRVWTTGNAYPRGWHPVSVV
ncbi:MAG: hypothetical protein H6741_01990 [Alphaproteobacteria bacterium]|nr:hypothetical protein [Alphaproteobacteria bacterium]MCB9791474.1 hypothetical protein [Alphaproteobacteria bacterium]